MYYFSWSVIWQNIYTQTSLIRAARDWALPVTQKYPYLRTINLHLYFNTL